jgi:acetyl-CoA carboxylase biotin carboxyl carrier protein
MVNSQGSHPHYSIPSHPSAAPETNVNIPTAHEHMIPAPMVGTFYRAPGPNDKPFVDVGSKVKVGDVLCIVEAMKMLNQIEAEREGIIKRVLIENGQPVEFGQALFILSDE